MAKTTKTSKAAKAPAKASKATAKKATKATKATKAPAKAAKATATKAGAKTGGSRKRLSPDAAAHLARVGTLIEEVTERLEHLHARYDELDDIEPDVGAGEDEGGASFDAGLVERDQIRAMIADEEVLMQRLDNAKDRVAAGTWRTCRVCGGDIGEARLEALPSTDLCVSCKAAGH
jgi:DnaK suppressor protein